MRTYFLNWVAAALRQFSWAGKTGREGGRYVPLSSNKPTNSTLYNLFQFYPNYLFQIFQSIKVGFHFKYSYTHFILKQHLPIQCVTNNSYYENNPVEANLLNKSVKK